MPIETLPEFYERMRSTIPVRRAAVTNLIACRRVGSESITRLRETLAELEAIPEEPEGRRLILEGSRAVHVDLTYEIEELRKDVLYVEKGEDALLADLAERHPGLRDEVTAGVEALAGGRFQAFVTDRDGTVNNYCGRYASSVQSAYNAVFLTRFARARTRRSVILTSAPLDNIGLADLAVTPPGTLVYTGSKGREYFDPKGRRRQFPIEPEKQRKLDELNRGLDELLASPGNEVFTLIGSGLQHKFGQTTVARQDINDSVPPDKSERFLEAVRSVVRTLDPEGTFFRIEDTQLDIEIILTVEGDESRPVRDFDKGDGVRFLNADLGLEMERGRCLICGDTSSDVPMLEASLALAPETRAAFVTRREELRERVRSLLPGVVLLSEPDALVALLNELAQRGT